MARRSGLGRGLGALIPTEVVTDVASSLIEVPVSRLKPSSFQPRGHFDEDAMASLTASVKELGVLQPVLVRPAEGDTYELIAGERRWRAAKRAGLQTIPAVIKVSTDDASLEQALVENLHRDDLNPLEEASAYQQLLSDFGITQEELAGRIGRSRPQITNTIRLLRLPGSVQKRVAAGVLSAGHARAILSAGDEESMEKLADKIVNEELSVRAAEAVVAAGPLKKKNKPSAGRKQDQLNEIAERLGDRLNTRVRIALGASKGSITIDFASVGDLNRILGELGEPGFN